MAVKRLQTDSEDLNRVQDGIVPALNALLSIPMLDGRLIETEVDASGHAVPLTLNIAYKLVEHKLGRKYRGFWVTGKNTNSNVVEDDPVFNTNPDPTKFIRLSCTVDGTLIKLWVY